MTAPGGGPAGTPAGAGAGQPYAGPAVPGPAEGPSGLPEPIRRLHPLSPLLRGARLAVLVVIAISWQGFANLGLRRWIIAVAGIAALTLIGSLISYLVTGYHVVGRELRIHEGVLYRRTRAVPLERLQSVELVEPLLARIFGLAELRLEVVGANRPEAPLAFLRVSEAVALRQRLLDLAQIGRVPAASAPAAAGAPAAPGAPAAGPGATQPPAPVPAAVAVAGQPLHMVSNRDLVFSQLLRPQWWILPLAIAAQIISFLVERRAGFIAVASTLTAVIGVIWAPIRVLLSDWRFSLAITPDGLRLQRGLLEARSQTVPPGRVQSVTVQWPLLWRPRGWVRARMDIAGVSAGGAGPGRSGLLPVGTVPVAEYVLAFALPGFRLTSVVVKLPPGRARWLDPFSRRVLGYQLGERAFVARSGLLTRQLIIVPYERIQSVRIRQGPLQRLLRLATVRVDTAARGMVEPASAIHIDAAEALAVATDLAERSRAARRPARPAE